MNRQDAPTSPSPDPSQGPPLLLVDGLSWVLGMLNDARIHGVGAAAESPRLDILGGLVALRGLHDIGHLVRVVLVHLAAEGFDEDFFGQFSQPSEHRRAVNCWSCFEVAWANS